MGGQRLLPPAQSLPEGTAGLGLAQEKFGQQEDEHYQSDGLELLVGSFVGR